MRLEDGEAISDWPSERIERYLMELWEWIVLRQAKRADLGILNWAARPATPASICTQALLPERTTLPLIEEKGSTG